MRNSAFFKRGGRWLTHLVLLGVVWAFSVQGWAAATVSISSSNDLVIVGSTFTVTASATNTGAAPLTDRIRIFQLVAGSPQQVGFVNFESSVGCSVVTLNTTSGPLQAVECAFTNLAVNAIAAFSVTVRATDDSRPGVVPIAVTVGPSNNAFTQVDIVADTLTDTDNDSVSDFNETLAGTNSNDGRSTPGDQIIDVLVLFSPGAAEIYGGDPTTRINHLFAVMNEIFSSSGVHAQFRVAAQQSIDADDSVNNTVILSQMLARSGVFSTLDNSRDEVAADIVLMLRPSSASVDNCGFASVLAVDLLGDFSVGDQQANALGTVSIDCRDRTAAHEVGHIMGTGHDHRDVNSRGTYAFSRGHGVDDLFVDVMGVAQLYGSATEVNLFSNPNRTCLGEPCGTATNDPITPAFAALSLDTARFQVAAFRNTRSFATLDLDANGLTEALTDGLLLLRALFGFDGNTLTDGVIGSEATRTLPASIRTAATNPRLDVDGDGSVEALTDGLLALRYLFDFHGQTLIEGALGTGATRTTAAAIESHLAMIATPAS